MPQRFHNMFHILWVRKLVKTRCQTCSYDSTAKLRRLQSVCLHFAPIRCHFGPASSCRRSHVAPSEGIAVLGKMVFKTLEATEAKGIPRYCQLLWLKACLKHASSQVHPIGKPSSFEGSTLLFVGIFLVNSPF